MKLFQYAVIWHPNEIEKKDGKKCKLVVDLKTVLAPSQEAAAMIVAREIPEEYIGCLEQVEIVIRPF